MQGSYYLDRSNITYSHGSVLSVERHPYQTLPYGYGSDSGGGRTDKLLEYVVGRFGPVASFSASYRADAWTLNIHRGESKDTQMPCIVTVIFIAVITLTGCPIANTTDGSLPTPTNVPTVTTESDGM